jgi:magnesium-transporting ATPase (P-type)
MTALRPAPDPTLTPAGEVAAALGVDPAHGLSADEAALRLQDYGPNEIDAEAPVPGWRRILEQFRDPLIYLLLAAIVISVVAWALEGAGGMPTDAIVIALIVVANAGLGYLQEARAANAVAALARMSESTVAVVRDSRQQRIPSRELVVGDVLVLAEGDAVGADARLLQAVVLKVTEAPLTGESEAVLKDVATLPGPAPLGDRLNMVFNGTAVTQGVGRAVVTATGMATEMGTIATLLRETEEDETPLQREIAHVGRMLGIAVVIVAAVVTATLFLTAEVDTGEEIVSALLLGVSLAVAAVPEGLPTVVTLVLAVGVQRLARHRAIVKELSSVETLGSASVICSDKTGTLTKGEMTLGRLITASGATEVTGVGYRPEGRVERGGRPVDEQDPAWVEIAALLSGGCVVNNAVLCEEDGDWVVQGDPTEGAFLVAERKLGLHDARGERFRRIGDIPFTSERKMMTTLALDGEREDVIALVSKGAPDVLLELCSHVLVEGRVEVLDARRRGTMLADIEQLSSEAFRALGVAYRDLARAEVVGDPDEGLEDELVYLGTAGIIDPPRAEAAAAVADARRAGIRVIMITGDHPLTASRIAADLGIVERGAQAASGAVLDAMDESRFRELVRTTSVYARVTPAHKLRIIDALREEGKVVAMTGDGVNDAPALKSADIGIAMGISGTEVTKEAANMILADDNFATIVEAVRQGRGIFQNIRKALRYLLSTNMGEVLTVFLGVVLAGVLGLSSGAGGAVVLPLLATQILWINLLTDSAPAMALGVDPQTDDVMNRPPRALTDRVIDGRMWVSVGLVGVVMAVVTLATLDRYLPGGILPGDRDLANARTAAFTVLVLAQLFHSFVARSADRSAFHGMFANSWLWGAVALSAMLQVAVVHLPFLGEAFGTSPLDLGQWAFCVLMASAILWATELEKLVSRAVARSRREGTV